MSRGAELKVSMRLLLLTQVLDKDDAILGFFHSWVEEFSKHFEHIDVICLKEGKHSLPPHVHVHTLGKEKGESNAKYLVRFYHYFWKSYMHTHADYVFFHMGAIYNILAAPFFVLRKIRKTTFIWWKTHGHINLMGRVALCFVDTVFTASRESFPVNSKKREVVGHAIDTDFFTPQSFVPAESPVILFVGRVMRVKRVELAIEALRVLRDEGIHATLRIVGSTPDELYLAELKQFVQKHALGEDVSFVAGTNQEGLLREYRAAAVVVNPSETGSLDKVVLEAMSCGVPVVAPLPAYEALLASFGLAAESQDAHVYAQVIKVVLNTTERRNELGNSLRAAIVKDHALVTLPKRLFSL